MSGKVSEYGVSFTTFDQKFAPKALKIQHFTTKLDKNAMLRTCLTPVYLLHPLCQLSNNLL